MFRKINGKYWMLDAGYPGFALQATPGRRVVGLFHAKSAKKYLTANEHGWTLIVLALTR